MNGEDVRDGRLDTAGTQRRDAFRVTDRVALSVRLVEPAEFGRLAKRLWARHGRDARSGPVDVSDEDAPARPSTAKLEMLARVQPEVHAWIVHLEARFETSGEAGRVGVPGQPGQPAAMDAPAMPVSPADGPSPSLVVGADAQVDLSEGGIGFRLGEPPEPGALVSLELGLSTRDAPLDLLGEIVRRAGGEGEGATRTSVRFRRTHPADRDALVAHIFAVQRRQLRGRRAG